MVMDSFFERFQQLVPQAVKYPLRDGVWHASARYGTRVISMECNRRGSVKYALSLIYDVADALLQISNRGEIVDLYGTPDQIAVLIYLAERCDPELSVLFRMDTDVERAKQTEIYQQLRDGTLSVPDAVVRVNGYGKHGKQNG